MSYVYVLQSKVDLNWLYIGFTIQLKERIIQHSEGKVRSTKSKRPLVLVYYEAYKNEKDARKREKHLKTHQQKDLLKERISNSLLAT